jgi:peptidoglycan/LPS O-acetylase OafA/YrhL
MNGERGLRAIGAVTLCLEVMVIFFAVLAVYGLGHSLPPVGGGLLLALAALLMLTPLVLRFRWGPYAALAVQGLVIAAGAITVPLYVLGAIFAAIWLGYLRMTHRLRAAIAAADPDAVDVPADADGAESGRRTPAQ